VSIYVLLIYVNLYGNSNHKDVHIEVLLGRQNDILEKDRHTELLFCDHKKGFFPLGFHILVEYCLKDRESHFDDHNFEKSFFQKPKISIFNPQDQIRVQCPNLFWKIIHYLNNCPNFFWKIIHYLNNF
jgi:hypothetical protein